MATIETKQHYLNLFYVTLGLLTGIVGSIWVYYLTKVLEKHYPNLDWDTVFIVSTIIFIVWLIFWIGYILKGMKKIEEGKKEDKTKPTKNSLIAEYQSLNDSVNRRSEEMLIADSFLFPTTLAVVTFAIANKEALGTSNIAGLPTAGFLPLLSSVLILIFYIFWLTTTEINKICFDRLHEIEVELHIEGHRRIYDRIRSKCWWKIRSKLWHIIFLLFIGAYLFSAYWLFKEPVIA